MVSNADIENVLDKTRQNHIHFPRILFQVRFEGLQNSIAREFYQFETIPLHESFPQTN